LTDVDRLPGLPVAMQEHAEADDPDVVRAAPPDAVQEVRVEERGGLPARAGDRAAARALAARPRTPAHAAAVPARSAPARAVASADPGAAASAAAPGAARAWMQRHGDGDGVAGVQLRALGPAGGQGRVAGAGVPVDV